MRLSARSRRALLAAVAGTTLVLSGCGMDTGSGSGSVSLGFVNGADTEFHTCLQKALEQTAKSEGAKVYTANSHQNSGTELSNIEDMISRNVSALIVQTVNVDALKGDIAKAKASNIPIYLTSVATSDVNDILGAAVVDLGKVGALDAGGSRRTRAARTYRSVSSRVRPVPPPICWWAVSPRRSPATPRWSRTSQACSTPPRRRTSPRT